MPDTHLPGAEFPARLRGYLHHKGLRLAEASRRTGIHVDTISRWTHATRMPEKAAFLQFCQRLGVTREEAKWLLDQSNPQKLELRKRELLTADRLVQEMQLAVSDGLLTSLDEKRLLAVKEAALALAREVRKLLEDMGEQ